MLALPGCAYLYQGEELGLPEVLDLPDELRQDPALVRSGGTTGRDGCRVPLPWSGDAPPYGFSTTGRVLARRSPRTGRPWPSSAQPDVPSSFLELYREALRLRRTLHRPADLERLPRRRAGPQPRRGALRGQPVQHGDPVPAGAVLLVQR